MSDPSSTNNPYAVALAGNDPLRIMPGTPARLATLLARLTPEQIATPPAPGKWSVRDVIVHMADCEIGFGWRLRQTLAGETNLQPFDQDAWSKPYAGYSLDAAMAVFTDLRAWNVTLIRTFTETDKQLPAHHPERGAMTLWTIVETIAGHDAHHLKTLEAH